jgi:hypothetical protein
VAKKEEAKPEDDVKVVEEMKVNPEPVAVQPLVNLTDVQEPTPVIQSSGVGNQIADVPLSILRELPPGVKPREGLPFGVDIFKKGGIGTGASGGEGIVGNRVTLDVSGNSSVSLSHSFGWQDGVLNISGVFGRIPTSLEGEKADSYYEVNASLNQSLGNNDFSAGIVGSNWGHLSARAGLERTGNFIITLVSLVV